MKTLITEEVKADYKRILGLISRRSDEVRELVDYLHGNTSWLTAPASGKAHLSEPGGLLVHSVGVTLTLLDLVQLLAPAIPVESASIVGLFHDLGKIGGFTKEGWQPRYILRKEKSEDKTYYGYNSNLVEMSPAARSLYIITKFVPLSDAEAQAILTHDGYYVPQNEFLKHRETPLSLLLHWADYWTAHVREDGRDVNMGNEGYWKIA